MKYLIGLLAIGVFVFGGCKEKTEKTSSTLMEPGKDYPTYGGNKAGNRYSPLKQINISTVKNLQVAWTYDAREKPDSNVKFPRPREIQCQPIVVNGILYGTTSQLSAFALNAATGEQVWRFKPENNNQKFNTSRGVVYWEDGGDKRILYSIGSDLYALNAVTGKPVTTFGNNGKVDLHDGLSANLGHDIQNLSVSATTPGVIYKNILVIGSSVTEQGDAAPGHIRAFDVVTGKLKWVFHTIPQPGEFGYATWPPGAYKKIGAANSWSGLTLDEKRGVVYFGTGSPSSDFYGGDRAGTNLFANCIMALDAETGKMKWYFQTIHHDLWDRDMACPPNLATIKQNGKSIDVLVEATKDGEIYVLDRDSGKSLFPIEERPVPVNGLPGEHPWATQKYPVKPHPLGHRVFSDSDITNISPEAHAYIKKRVAEFPKTENKFTPPSVAGTILFGYSGGAEWGGNAIDPDGIFYQNANDDPWELQMIDMETLQRKIAALSTGNKLYYQNCAGCHGGDREGGGAQFPSLRNIGSKRSAAEIKTLVENGSGRMPSFKQLPEQERTAIVNFLLNKEPKRPMVADEHNDTSKAIADKKSDFPYIPAYVSKAWKRFVDQDGYNGTKPPWGTLNAIDLSTGDYKWRVTLGEYPELTKKGIPATGTESYGGPVVTAGGLIFIAATRDERIRAFDKNTGKIVWEYQLPAGGFATPITYEVNGKQYVVIACGGARQGSKPGGWYVAFALK